jgi:dihydrofolate synthase/folylpolyglutamate synthase
MNYATALDFLLSRTDYERWPGYQYASRFDLRRMYYLLERLGNPHLASKSVHIAGSKGKGSTAAMIAASLQAAGYRTGLYTSPHLVTLRERTKVNGKPILKSELACVVARMKPVVRSSDRDCPYGELSTFELLTAAAFLHFQRQGVDYQVLEAGLGGRLDATNVVMPELAVITTISFDHTEVLGTTLARIAAEKAGIIKPYVPVVSTQQAGEAAAVIRKASRSRSAVLTEVGRDVTWQSSGHDRSRQSLQVNGVRQAYETSIPLLGEHQLLNAATAVAALEALGVPKQHIEAGLALTDWPGRLQLLWRRPMLVIDGAHTSESANKLRLALKRHFDFDRLIFIIGTSADKDLSGIVSELAPAAHKVVATRSRHPRATDPAVVATAFRMSGADTLISGDVKAALQAAKSVAGPRALICATGSLFVIGEVIEQVKCLRPEVYS